MTLRVAVDGAALGSHLGGDETFVRGLLDGLDACATPEVEVTVYVPVGEPVPWGAFRSRPIPRRRGTAHFAVDLPRALWADRSRLDLVLSVTHAPLVSPVGRVLVIGDLSFEHLPDAYPTTTRLRLRTLVRRQVRSCRLVVTPSEFSRADVVERYGIPPERVAVVPNRVRPSPPLDPGAPDRAAALGVREPFVLCLGNRHPRKNVPALVDAFSLARRASTAVGAHQLVVAGAPWWDDGLPVPDPASGVVELGRVDDGVRDHLLRRATLLAYPSRFEGFGLPPLEAMAMGTPVVAGAVASLPEVCGDAALLVDLCSTDALAEALRAVCEDPALRARLSAAGRGRAATFDAGRTGAAALAALRTAAGLATGGHRPREVV